MPINAAGQKIRIRHRNFDLGGGIDNVARARSTFLFGVHYKDVYKSNLNSDFYDPVGGGKRREFGKSLSFLSIPHSPDHAQSTTSKN